MGNIDGGPAFPGVWVNESDRNAAAPDGQGVPPGGSVQMVGMKLRDYFAAKALQGWLAGLPDGCDVHDQAIARRCFAIADVMLKARDA